MPILCILTLSPTIGLNFSSIPPAMLARLSGRRAYGVEEVVDDAIDVRLGVKVLVPVMLGLEATDPRETARDAEGV